MALNAKYIVSKPIATMKRFMKGVGFHEIEHDQIDTVKRNRQSKLSMFQHIQGVNNWLISPETLISSNNQNHPCTFEL